MRTALNTSDPKSSDLHHVILSFEAKDARMLERFDGPDRNRPCHVITRRAVADITERLKAAGVKWVACVHHDDNRHIHLPLRK